jgi:hypothetical protein
MTRPNKPDAVNPAMALRYAIEDSGAGSLIWNVSCQRACN